MRMHADLDARRSRVAAAWVVALVVTVIAAVAHVAAGGAAPHPTALVAGGLVSGFLGMAVVCSHGAAGLSSRRLALVVALDQTVQHVAFSLLGSSGGSSLATHADAVAGHAAHGALAAPSASIAATGIPVAATAPGLMVAHHAIAALLAFALIRRGSSAIAAALRALGFALARLLEPVAPAAVPLDAPRALLDARELLPSPAAVVLGGSGRRGPPAIALAR